MGRQEDIAKAEAELEKAKTTSENATSVAKNSGNEVAITAADTSYREVRAAEYYLNYTAKLLHIQS